MNDANLLIETEGLGEWDCMASSNLSAKQFRRAMGMFASGVTVLSVAHPDGVHSMTANAFMSVSLEPPLVVVSIAHTARFGVYLARQHARFGISFLSSEQMAECGHFGGKPVAGLTAEYDWYHGAPVLSGSLAQFVVQVHSTLDAGDHRLIVAELKWMRSTERKPLLFYAGKLGSHHWREPASSLESALDFDVWA